MFNTIKSKMLALVLSILSVLIVAFSVFSFLYFKYAQSVYIDASYLSISSLIQNIKSDIISIEYKTKEMALFGEIFYDSGKKRKVIDEYVLKAIESDKISISGGIWFEPYVLNTKIKNYCSFAYFDVNDVVRINNDYSTLKNSYLKSKWYKELTKQILEGKKIAWSTPYYEPNGVHTYMVTAGSGIFNKGKLVGISTADWDIDAIIEDVSKIKPTRNSFLLFADAAKDFILVSTDKYLDNKKLFGKSLDNIPWYNDKLKNKDSFVYQNKSYITYISNLANGMVLIVNVPEDELYFLIRMRFVSFLFILLIFSFILCISIYSALNMNIIEPIGKLTAIAEQIGSGKSENFIKIDNPAEFANLALTFDKMTNDLKKAMAKQAVIDYELNIAKSIQMTSLPRIFPPYPDKSEFDIYANMQPAKEVGGDFYDFYYVGPEHFMFLVADVSGKGIPAALFMMKVKTLINNVSKTFYSPKELIKDINKKICENNSEGFFVTMFACIVDIRTGETSLINCGHNPPLIKHKNNEYDFIKISSNIVLGAFEDADYDITTVYLKKGDRIFLYTDGVTEAFNLNKEAFGEKRLKKSLNKNPDLSLSQTINDLKSEINTFADGNIQSDDITMLAFDYFGISNEKTYKTEAKIENYQKFYQILNNSLINWRIDLKTANKIYMCAEEIYANVTFYAYGEKTGDIEVNIQNNEDEIILSFIDEGIEYNPLNNSDPDITLPPEERQIGGLGMYMVKKLTDSVKYERKNGKNILVLNFKKITDN